MLTANTFHHIFPSEQISSFRNFIWDFYAQHQRPFAWRNVEDPYLVVVSEIMLQQTQTYRVEPKFDAFIAAFPDFQSLADASQRDVLSAWQGLGYNRRGMFLHKIAQKVVAEFGGALPNDPEILVTFPGIGKATAASICSFAFNRPTVFIETNIRTVFIHSFFKDRDGVHDKELMPLIEQSLDHENPREWYYALMDYGVHLKKMLPNPSRKSRHHTKQSRFEGSDRQIRGMIIRLLTDHGSLTKKKLLSSIDRDAQRVEKIALQLVVEGLISTSGNNFFI
jgi:A/G-specific adenine glycosylase